MQYLIGVGVLGIFLIISYFVLKRKRNNVDEIVKQQLKPVILSSDDLEIFIKRFGGNNA